MKIYFHGLKINFHVMKIVFQRVSSAFVCCLGNFCLPFHGYEWLLPDGVSRSFCGVALPNGVRVGGSRCVVEVEFRYLLQAVLFGSVRNLAAVIGRNLDGVESGPDDVELAGCSTAQVDYKPLGVGAAVRDTHYDRPPVDRIAHLQPGTEREFQVCTGHAVFVVDFSACRAPPVQLVGVVRGITLDDGLLLLTPDSAGKGGKYHQREAKNLPVVIVLHDSIRT